MAATSVNTVRDLRQTLALLLLFILHVDSGQTDATMITITDLAFVNQSKSWNAFAIFFCHTSSCLKPEAPQGRPCYFYQLSHHRKNRRKLAAIHSSWTVFGPQAGSACHGPNAYGTACNCPDLSIHVLFVEPCNKSGCRFILYRKSAN